MHKFHQTMLSASERHKQYGAIMNGSDKDKGKTVQKRPEENERLRGLFELESNSDQTQHESIIQANFARASFCANVLGIVSG